MQILKGKSILEKMERQAKKQMIAYHDDFYVYDKKTIEQAEGDRSFFWMVCDSATHLVFLEDEYVAEKIDMLEQQKGDYIHKKRGKLFFCNTNGKMNQISFDEAKKILKKSKEIW